MSADELLTKRQYNVAIKDFVEMVVAMKIHGLKLFLPLTISPSEIYYAIYLSFYYTLIYSLQGIINCVWETVVNSFGLQLT